MDLAALQSRQLNGRLVPLGASGDKGMRLNIFEEGNSDAKAVTVLGSLGPTGYLR